MILKMRKTAIMFALLLMFCICVSAFADTTEFEDFTVGIPEGYGRRDLILSGSADQAGCGNLSASSEAI